jgi:uncharacterized delta-60 repeat protein
MAVPGDLVQAFSGDGMLSADFLASGHDRGRSIVVQADGKLVAGGNSLGSAATNDFSIARYDAGGTLDPSFSGDGLQVIDIGGRLDADELGEVALQADGKIVAGGATSDGLAVVRLNPAGTLDPSFSGDGMLLTAVPPNTLVPEEFGAVAIQPDGKIVVTGGASSMVIARYNSDGTPDTTFAGDGLLTGPPGNVKDLLVQPDGKLAVAGYGFDSNLPNAFSVARLNADGSFDNSFSGDGIQTTATFGFNPARALVRQPDGKLVAAGGSMVARYETDGTADDSFSEDGQHSPANTSVFGLALQPNGKLLLAGRSIFQPTFDFAVERLNADGTPDDQYGNAGVALTDFGFGDQISSVALQPNGTAVVAGQAESAAPDFFPEADFALARYTGDGQPDTTFSGDGRQTTNLQVTSRNFASAVAVQPNERIVVGGYTSTFETDGGFELARYLSDGQPDPSFSGDGHVHTAFSGRGALLADMALEGDGDIVAVGGSSPNSSQPGEPDFALARYTDDGQPDTTFSGDGEQLTDFAGGSDQATGVAVQADGKLVVSGVTAPSQSAFHFAVARYNTDGTLDATFSGDGRATTDFGFSSQAHDVVVQPDGKIVLAGSLNSGPGSSEFAIARYNPDGTPDTSFSGDGRDRGGFSGGARALVLQPGGRILVVGSSNAQFTLVRYTPEGSLDTTFSGDGLQVTTFAGRASATDVVLDPDGRILVVGVMEGDFAAARYHPSGNLDGSFAGDGRQSTDFGGTGFFGDGDRANAVALFGDDYMLAGTDESDEGDFAVLRYEGGGPPLDLSPAETTITGGATSVSSPSLPSFTFSSSEPGSTFQCLLVGASGFTGCASPQTPASGPLPVGRYRFEVRAIDGQGNVDPTPAAIEFEITPGADGGSMGGTGGTGGTVGTGGTGGTGGAGGSGSGDQGTSPFGRIRATRNGVACTLRCPAGSGPCAARLTLYASSGASARRIYGRRSRVLAAGETRTVSVKLNRRGRTLLRSQRRLRVRFEARLRYAGTLRVKTRRVTLRARRP